MYVTEIYSDSIGLSWSTLPPEHHNGEIIGYNITVTAIYSGETFTIFSATNSTIVSSLVPFASYSYSVAAVTIAGVGPYSSVSTVLTGEAGMYINFDPLATASMSHVLSQLPSVHQSSSM